MYWPDRWEKRLSQPRGEEKPARRAEEGAKSADLLDAVIDRSSKQSETPRKKQKLTYLAFSTAAVESRFKSCLARAPVECRMEQRGRKRILALRPKNLFTFDQLITNSGLADCEAATRALKWLRENPDEFLRFEAR